MSGFNQGYLDLKDEEIYRTHRRVPCGGIRLKNSLRVLASVLKEPSMALVVV
jgi:hypothetical protein